MVLLVILLVIELAVVIIAFVETSNETLKKKIEEKVEADLNQGKLGTVERKVYEQNNFKTHNILCRKLLTNYNCFR